MPFLNKLARLPRAKRFYHGYDASFELWWLNVCGYVFIHHVVMRTTTKRPKVLLKTQSKQLLGYLVVEISLTI